MNPNRKIDRRIERTRHQLREALMALVVERGYDTITIQDITDRANIARTTFYLHFRDKDDLLFQSMREVYESLVEKSLDSTGTMQLGTGDISDFQHVAEHADFYRVMFSDKGSAAFINRVRDYLAEAIEQFILRPMIAAGARPRIPISLIAQLGASNLITTLKWWLDHDMQDAMEVIATYPEEFTLHGLDWALEGWQ